MTKHNEADSYWVQVKVVAAIQWTGDNLEEIKLFVKPWVYEVEVDKYSDQKNLNLSMPHEVYTVAKLYDYLVKLADNTIHILSPDTFEYYCVDEMPYIDEEYQYMFAEEMLFYIKNLVKSCPAITDFLQEKIDWQELCNSDGFDCFYPSQKIALLEKQDQYSETLHKLVYDK